MAAITAATVAAGISAAAAVTGTVMSFSQAGEAKAKAADASKAADKAIAEAKSKLDINFYDSLGIQKEFMEDMYYSVSNFETGEVVIPFGTGSSKYTKLSYDNNGNYFNLWMNSFVPGFMYEIVFLVNRNQESKIIRNDFKFKVI